MRTLHLRCSSLPLAFLCPGSVRPGEVEISETSDPAELGTAAHAGLGVMVETGRVEWESVPTLAEGHQFSEAELRMLLSNGAKLWAQISDSFPDAKAEVELRHEGPGYVLTGHVDVRGRSLNQARLGDWKGGRVDSEYREQVLGYAALDLFNDDTLESAQSGVIWLREMEYEPHSLSRDQLQAWEDRLVARVVQWDGAFTPGSHCQYCKRNHECKAANALVRRDVAAIANLEFDEAALELMTPAQKADLLVLTRRVAKIADRVDAAIKRDVIEHGDVIGDGKRLTLQTEEHRHLNVVKAWPVLEEHLDDVSKVVKISLPKAEEIVREKAGKGNGAGAARRLVADLKAADAIGTTTTAKLVVKRA